MCCVIIDLRSGSQYAALCRVRSGISPWLKNGQGLFVRNPDFLLVAAKYAPLPCLMLAEQCQSLDPENRPSSRAVRNSIQVSGVPITRLP